MKTILDFLMVVGLVLEKKVHSKRILLKMVQNLQRQMDQGLLNRVQQSTSR